MPVIVTSKQSTAPCTEMWVDPAVVEAGVPGITSEDAVQAAVDATWLLWRLTGDRFHGVQCWVDDYDVYRGDLCNIELRQFPVLKITDVSYIDLCGVEFNGVPTTGIGDDVASGWCYRGSQILQICACSGVGGDYFDFRHNGVCAERKTVRVRYSTESNLPPGAVAAASKLAVEHGKDMIGKPCGLPDRITNITREGVSWTVFDPQDFLEKGLLGMKGIDQWITVANRIGLTRPIDTATWHPVIFTSAVNCGPDCDSMFET